MALLTTINASPEYEVLPADYGFNAWNFPISHGQAGYPLVSGTVVAIRVKVPVPTLVTNINMYLSLSGTVLTSGQGFVALYNSAKDLLSQSADQSGTFAAAAGLKTMALSAAQTVPAGECYAVVWCVGAGTMPQFRSSFNSPSANANLSADNSRWASANTGITTTAPSTLGTFTAVAGSPWVGLS